MDINHDVKTKTGKMYSVIVRRGCVSENVWDYISHDGHVLNQAKIIELLDDYYKWNRSFLASDLYDIANMSQDGRETIRIWMKHHYEDMMPKERFLKSLINRYSYRRRDRLVAEGVDPYDAWYDKGNNRKWVMNGYLILSMLAAALLFASAFFF
jgi:hypothetical protein